MSRVVSTRVYHTRLSVVRNSTAHRIGRSLATLRPTWVTGLLRYARNQYPTHDEVRVWKRIRAIVHRDSPAAQFDVVLNAEQYRTPAAVTRTMRRLNAKLGNEGWFFDFLSSASRRHPKMVKAAIAWAHTRGQWIGGNVFGLVRQTRLPGQRRLPQRPGRRLSPQPERGAQDLEEDARPLPPQQRPRRQVQRRLPVHQELQHGAPAAS